MIHYSDDIENMDTAVALMAAAFNKAYNETYTKINNMLTTKIKDAESVEHPAHYGGKDNQYEVIKVIRAWKMGFSLGNAIKYIARAGKKDPSKTVDDLKKAIFYINEEISYLESRESNA